MLKTKLGALFAALVWLAVWEAASLLLNQQILLVSPVRAVSRLFELMGDSAFYRAVGTTFFRILLGFALAAALGVPLAYLAFSARWVKVLLAPLMQAVKATPVASFVILALLFVSSKYLSVFISFLMVLPAVYVSTLSGFEASDAKLNEMAKVFHLSRAARARAIDFPSAYPYFLSACGSALGMCWKAGVAAEVIGLPDGSIGTRLYQAKIFLNTPDLYAWTLAIILLSVAFEKGALWLLTRAKGVLS